MGGAGGVDTKQEEVWNLELVEASTEEDDPSVEQVECKQAEQPRLSPVHLHTKHANAHARMRVLIKLIQIKQASQIKCWKTIQESFLKFITLNLFLKYGEVRLR